MTGYLVTHYQLVKFLNYFLSAFTYAYSFIKYCRRAKEVQEDWCLPYSRPPT